MILLISGLHIKLEYHFNLQVNFHLPGEDLENVTEAIVSEGLVEVRRGGIKPSE